MTLHALDARRHDVAAVDQLGPKLASQPGRSYPDPQFAAARGAEQAVGSIARKKLVEPLLTLGNPDGQKVGREEALDEVVIAAVAVPPAGDKVGR